MWCFLLLLIGCRETLAPDEGPGLRSAPGAWNRLLDQSVNSTGEVDYGLIASERQVLDNYVRWLSRPDARRHRSVSVSHAYWLNVFNTLTIYQIVERDLQSVTEVPSVLPWTAAGFFAGTEFILDGQALSLWEIGHEQITHDFQDYRDFGALTMGIQGGPPARGRLFMPESLGAQLDDQMSSFMMSEAGLHINADGTLVFNHVFEQYAQEFDLYTAGASLCDIAIRHTHGRRKTRLIQARDSGCEHTFQPLDWSLNGTWQ